MRTWSSCAYSTSAWTHSFISMSQAAEDAALIFDAPFLEAEDERSDYGELRFRALGSVGDDYFMVAYGAARTGGSSAHGEWT